MSLKKKKLSYHLSELIIDKNVWYSKPQTKMAMLIKYLFINCYIRKYRYCLRIDIYKKRFNDYIKLQYLTKFNSEF